MLSELLTKQHQRDFINRGFSRPNFHKIASVLAAGAALPFYNERALAQFSMVRNIPPDAVKINANENPMGPCAEAADAIHALSSVKIVCMNSAAAGRSNVTPDMTLKNAVSSRSFSTSAAMYRKNIEPVSRGAVPAACWIAAIGSFNSEGRSPPCRGRLAAPRRSNISA